MAYRWFGTIGAFKSRPFQFSSFSTSSPVFKKMPPKKAAAAEKKTLLGRPGNNLKIGIVGQLLNFQVTCSH
jgi:hypothetical protein